MTDEHRPEPDAKKLADIFALLGDETRFMMLREIAQRPEGVSVMELQEAFGKSQQATSHHLKELHSAGLVEYTHVGKSNIYRIIPGNYEAAMKAATCALEILASASPAATGAGVEGDRSAELIRAAQWTRAQSWNGYYTENTPKLKQALERKGIAFKISDGTPMTVGMGNAGVTGELGQSIMVGTQEYESRIRRADNGR